MNQRDKPQPSARVFPPARHRLRPYAPAAGAAILIAGFVLPVSSYVLGEYSHQAAMALPSFVLVAGLCLLYPHVAMPPVSLLGMYAIATAVQLLHRGSAPSILSELAAGEWEQLKVPAAAIAMGYLVVLLRRRFRVFPHGFRTNLRLLVRRPGVLVRKYWIVLTPLLIGAGLDAATTIAFMLRYGPQDELHPVMRATAEVFGVWPGVIFGTVGRLAFVLLVAAVSRRCCAWVFAICAVLYLLAAGHNHFGWFQELLISLGA